MAQGLASLAQEDPTFRVETDRDTAETLVWGMGELHLEVMVERLRSEWNVDVGVGAPRVAYQETPMRAMTGVSSSGRCSGKGRSVCVNASIDSNGTLVSPWVRGIRSLTSAMIIGAVSTAARAASTEVPSEQ